MNISDLIIVKNHHFCILNKPAAMPAVPDTTGDMSLLQLAGQYFRQTLYVVHRIDRPVSGLVLFAKSKKMAAYFSSLWQDKKISKTYLALIEGRHDPATGIMQDHIDPRISRGNKSRTHDGSDVNAETGYEIIAAMDNYSLVRLQPHTGRHHQLRVQLASHLAPIKGDVKYGARRANKDRSIHLHAYSIAFAHPVSGEMLQYTAPLPDDKLWQDAYATWIGTENLSQPPTPHT